MHAALALLRDHSERSELNTARYAVRLADDALVHAQRLCEWSGKAPMLEEDLALANVALDYLGRARMLYRFTGEQLSCDEDQLAFHRDSSDFRNLLMLELPRGDFAFTMLRQFLLDAYEKRFFAALSDSGEPALAAIAVKSLKEIEYHHRRSQLWVRRLGLGTQESHARMQSALDTLWGYVDELFAQDELESALIEGGIAVDRSALKAAWLEEVQGLLGTCELKLPEGDWQVSGGRQGQHTEHLSYLLGEMQVLQRNHPGLQW